METSTMVVLAMYAALVILIASIPFGLRHEYHAEGWSAGRIALAHVGFLVVGIVLPLIAIPYLLYAGAVYVIYRLRAS